METDSVWVSVINQSVTCIWTHIQGGKERRNKMKKKKERNIQYEKRAQKKGGKGTAPAGMIMALYGEKKKPKRE